MSNAAKSTAGTSATPAAQGSRAAAPLEAVPTRWTAADEAFFRLVADVLPAAYLAGATTLLAGNDIDDGSDVDDASDIGPDHPQRG